MQASKSLRRPENWPDFESLCKRLWGEIWKCPEIKKNGRAGQKQNGVDVYGVPLNETEYFGIQCKGKDEYTNKQFTEEEILKEIEMAKLFQPPLRKFYLVTTAVKDAKIEEFVRKKNIENRKAGLFEVHIFSWEDIVDLIDENRDTHDWYVKNQNFKTNSSVSVTFPNGSTELIIIPRFNRLIKYYTQNNLREQYLSSSYYKAAMNWQSSFNKPETLVNLSYCKFNFQIHNTGTEPIENYKMSFEFDGNILDLAKTNEEYTGFVVLNRNLLPIVDTVLDKTSFTGEIIPDSNILVSDDVYYSNDIFIKPIAEDYVLPIKWKLISKSHKDDGILKLVVKPQIERKIKEEVVVKDKSEVRVEQLGIEDFIETKEVDED